MQHKYVDGKVIHGDIINPQVVIAEFNPDFLEASQRRLVNILNHGDEMIQIYKQYRDNLHISNVQEMILRMEKVFNDYDYQDYEIKRLTV